MTIDNQLHMKGWSECIKSKIMKRIQFFVLLIMMTSNSIFGQDIQVVNKELNKYPNVRDFCISSDEVEVYFTLQSLNQELSKIACVKNNKWEKIMLLPFCDKYTYLEPFLSNDGRRLYFVSNRPKNETDTIKSDFDIWYVERKSKTEQWSKPINMGAPVNSENDEFYPTLADNGNLYFTMDSKSGLGKDDIYYCQWNGTNYSKPILLNNNINSNGYEFNAFISNDERFLIYTKYNTIDGYGSGDLFISTKDKNGEWQTSKNLGNIINTKYMEYCPYYNSKTNTLYFTSKRSNLAPQKFNNIKEYFEKITGSENGSSKIYKFKIQL